MHRGVACQDQTGQPFACVGLVLDGLVSSGRSD